jgi:hypothetical protein
MGAASTAPGVSWLGTPCRQGGERRGKAGSSPPRRATPTKPSAPAGVAPGGGRMIPGGGWGTSAARRGSARRSSGGGAAGRPTGASVRRDAVLSFDPARERFTPYPGSAPDANVRQLSGRPGEILVPESGLDRIRIIRYGTEPAG